MKKIMIQMTVLMGFFMSLTLSLVGTLMGGHFTVPSWLLSFALSFVISLIIGFLVPIKKLGDSACEKRGVPAQSFKGTLISAAISDVIYTPVITIVMVVVMLTLAAKNAPAGSVPPIPAVLIPSLLVSLVAGYIVIVLIQPPLIRFLTRNLPRGRG